MSPLYVHPDERHAVPSRLPRLYGPHIWKRDSRCRRRAENCQSFSILHYSMRDYACVFCRECIGCVADVDRCTAVKSKGAV